MQAVARAWNRFEHVELERAILYFLIRFILTVYQDAFFTINDLIIVYIFGAVTSCTMEDLQRLRASRKAYRAHLTTLYKKITEVQNASPLDELHIATLENYSQQLKRKQDILATLDEQITKATTKPEELETEIFETEEIYSTIVERYSELTTFIAIKRKDLTLKNIVSPSNNTINESSPEPVLQLDKSDHQETLAQTEINQSPVSPPPQTEEPPSNITDNATSVHNDSGSYPIVSRLPKLSLPTFSGDPITWKSFWDSFKTTIHLNHTLHDVQKFNYLKAQLRGDAARVIEGLPMTSANYKHSIDLLTERFGQQQKIVNAHMQCLLDLPKPDTGLTSLQLFYDTIENHIRGLAALGQSQESYGSLLIPIILGKLPADIRRSLAREHCHLEWTIDQLRHALLK